MSTADETTARTRAAVEAYVRAWATDDKEALLAAFAEDGVWIDPVGTPPYRGRAAIAGFWDQAHAGGQRFTPEVERIIACGNEAILLFRMVVRSPDGGGMTIDVCDQMVVGPDGRIQVAKAFWDATCLGQL